MFRTGGGARQNGLEAVKIFWHAIVAKILRASCRFLFLIFVIEGGRDRVMRIVGLQHEIGDRQLDLMRPKPAGFVLRREIVPAAEIEENRRGLPDDEIAIPEER